MNTGAGAPMDTGRPSVAVVGGGLAGITAALECARGGMQVTLLERQQRLGGATWSFQRGGLWFDNGQHVFLRCCTAYRELLATLGVDHLVTLQDRLDLPVLRPGHPTARLSRGGLPAPLHLGPALLRYRHLRPLDRLRLGPAALALRRLDRTDPSLDEQRFGSWLTAHGQSPAAVAGVWDLICRPTVNLAAADASLAVAATVFQVGLLDGNDGADIGWSRVPLGRLHGEAALRALTAGGVHTRTGVGVSGIDGRPGGGFVVRAAGGDHEVDAVVLAVPHDRVAGLAPTGVTGLERVGELGWSPVVNVQIVYDRPVTALPLAAAIDTPVQFVFDRTEAAGLEQGQCLGVSLSAADEHLGVAADALIDRFTAALADLFPAARTATVLDAVVTKERAATFRATPGTARLRPPARTSMPGLALAGAWTDTGWPATMEGAVRSGRAAAAVALAAAGHTRSLNKEALGCP